MYKEKQIIKRWHTIGEVKRATGLPESKIRYWTDVLGLCRKRSASNGRRYSEKEFSLIKQLMKLDEELTLKGMKKAIKLKIVDELVRLYEKAHLHQE